MVVIDHQEELVVDSGNYTPVCLVLDWKGHCYLSQGHLVDVGQLVG